MFRLGMRSLALFDCLSNLPIAVFQPLLKGCHSVVLLGNGVMKITLALAASNGEASMEQGL
jgi:hypothetical protein